MLFRRVFAPFVPWWAAAMLIVGGLSIVYAFISAAQDVLQWGLPPWAWGVIGTVAVIASLSVMHYHSYYKANAAPEPKGGQRPAGLSRPEREVVLQKDEIEELTRRLSESYDDADQLRAERNAIEQQRVKETQSLGEKLKAVESQRDHFGMLNTERYETGTFGAELMKRPPLTQSQHDAVEVALGEIKVALLDAIAQADRSWEEVKAKCKEAGEDSLVHWVMEQLDGGIVSQKHHAVEYFKNCIATKRDARPILAQLYVVYRVYAHAIIRLAKHAHPDLRGWGGYADWAQSHSQMTTELRKKSGIPVLSDMFARINTYDEKHGVALPVPPGRL